MVRVRFNFVFMWLLIQNINSGKAADGLATYRFTKVPSTAFNSTQFGLAASPWPGLSSTLTCARSALQSYSDAVGYFFEPGSGLCTPVLRPQAKPGLGSSEVPTGYLYISPGPHCPYPFQGVTHGSDRQVSCVWTITPATTYELATSECVSLGGHLISVWTTGKLRLVAELANGKNTWVGLDDMAEEGHYVWQQDGSELTQDLRQAIFATEEPNAVFANEDCIIIWNTPEKLGDSLCNSLYEALCETPPHEYIQQ